MSDEKIIAELAKKLQFEKGEMGYLLIEQALNKAREEGVYAYPKVRAYLRGVKAGGKTKVSVMEVSQALKIDTGLVEIVFKNIKGIKEGK